MGSASTLDAVVRWLDVASTVVVIGPLWLGEVLSTRVRVLLLTEPEERQHARRVVKRTTGTDHRLTVALAGVDLPLFAGSVDALLVESASVLDAESIARWMATLVPAIRPGGRLLALDATDNPAAEARLSGLFLAASLGEIVQERPREGVVLTVGVAPPAPVIAARFGGSRPIEHVATDGG